MEEPNDSNNEHTLTVDAGLPSELGTVSAPTGTEPESQLSPSLQTMGPLNTEGTGEELAPGPSKEDLSLGPALSESGDAPTAKVEESETGEASDAVIEHLASEDTSRVLFEHGPSVAEESEVIDPVGRDNQSTETGDKSAEKAGDVQPKQDNTEMTAAERSPDEGLRYSEDQTDASSSQGVTPLSDINPSEVEPPSPNNEAYSEPHAETEMSLDVVDGASERATQGGQTLIYFAPQCRFIPVAHAHIHHGAICVSKSHS